MNTPKLRFKEFNDEYKSYKFYDVAKLYRGSSPRPIVNFITKSEDSVNWIKIGDVSPNETYINSTSEKITKEGAKKSRRVYKGEIILSNSMSFGRPYILNLDGCIHDGWFVVRDYEKLLNKKYLYHFMSSPLIQKQYKTLSAGGVVSNISSELVYSVKLNIPSKEEQHKVAKFLSLLDKKIELQTKKIEDLKLFKKGLHDKLFNEVTGNDYLLSDIAIFENGKGHENIVDENGKYILINSKFISTECNVTKKCSEQLTPLFKNDITMVMSDLPNGKALAKCYYIDENNKYSLNQRICKIKIKDDSIINSKYLFYLLDRNPYYLRFDDGVNQTNLKKDDILSLNLVLPSIKDQERNSKTLTIIDNFIEKENNKLSKLNLLKKGLMQSMFV